MTFGSRLKSFRIRSGLTMKALGLMFGFPESNADIRIAQYETGVRRPRKTTVNSMAVALGVTPNALTVPDIETDMEFIHLLFALEDEYGLKPNLVAGTFFLHMDGRETSRVNPLYSALKIWGWQFARLKRGETSKESYDCWRYNLVIGKR